MQSNQVVLNKSHYVCCLCHLTLFNVLAAIFPLLPPPHPPPCIPYCTGYGKTVKIYIHRSFYAYLILSVVSCTFPFFSEKEYGKTNSLTSTHCRILSLFSKNSTKASQEQNSLCKGKQSPHCLKPTEAWIQQARKSGFRAPSTGSERLWPHDTNADLM